MDSLAQRLGQLVRREERRLVGPLRKGAHRGRIGVGGRLDQHRAFGTAGDPLHRRLVADGQTVTADCVLGPDRIALLQDQHVLKPGVLGLDRKGERRRRSPDDDQVIRRDQPQPPLPQLSDGVRNYEPDGPTVARSSNLHCRGSLSSRSPLNDGARSRPASVSWR